MTLVYDSDFRYRGYHGCPSRCRLRVFEPNPDNAEETNTPTVVVFTELANNPGTSITNRIEHLATEVFKLLEKPPSGITVIEHYEDRAFIGNQPLFKEEFDVVTLTWISCLHCEGFIDPRWNPIAKAEVEEIIGQSLETISAP
jgi:hypothetical protein